MKRAGGRQLSKAAEWSILGAFFAGCALVIYWMFAGPSTPAAPPPPVIVTRPSTTGAVTVPGLGVKSPGAGVKTTEARSVLSLGQLDPTLRMDAMLVTESLTYSGSGRNIFSASSAPIDIPKPAASARGEVTPVAPPRPVSTGPPPPPPIDLKFFGMASTADGRRQAFLLHGDDVYLAAQGEIVGRRYKVITIGTGSVVVEDMPNNNRQTLPVEQP